LEEELDAGGGTLEPIADRRLGHAVDLGDVGLIEVAEEVEVYEVGLSGWELIQHPPNPIDLDERLFRRLGEDRFHLRDRILVREAGLDVGRIDHLMT